ncbi:hypothetical protein Pelo_11357 [Pelomyxa schiedti]|nr:hypothetical protein Pelo_11357 [Pelomyxa schiedti]
MFLNQTLTVKSLSSTRSVNMNVAQKYRVHPHDADLSAKLAGAEFPCFRLAIPTDWRFLTYFIQEVCIFEGQPLFLPFQLLCLSGASCSFMVNGVEKRSGTLSIPLWSPDLCGSVQV